MVSLACTKKLFFLPFTSALAWFSCLFTLELPTFQVAPANSLENYPITHLLRHSLHYFISDHRLIYLAIYSRHELSLSELAWLKHQIRQLTFPLSTIIRLLPHSKQLLLIHSRAANLSSSSR